MCGERLGERAERKRERRVQRRREGEWESEGGRRTDERGEGDSSVSRKERVMRIEGKRELEQRETGT